jgi:hypothetical protein
VLLGGERARQQREAAYLTIATAFARSAGPDRLILLLRRYPLLSYFLIAYAFTAAYDILVLARFSDSRASRATSGRRWRRWR